MRVTLYSKPGCPLCEELKAALLDMQREISFLLLEQNIEENPQDFERFRYLIPVLDIEDGEMLYPPHTWSQVYHAIQFQANRPNRPLTGAGSSN
jgi:hypothetical protein